MISSVFLSVWLKQPFCEIGKNYGIKGYKNQTYFIFAKKKIESGAENKYLSNEYLDNLDDLYMFLNGKVTFTFLICLIFFPPSATVAQWP